jgi:6-phospho-beta-glucosidase
MTASAKLSVLGGGSPFTLALIDAMASATPTLQPHHTCLYGRVSGDLDTVARYATTRLGPLGWTISQTTSLDESLEGSAVIIQQIRFGGLDGRAADEEIASACGLGADETLGPAAAHSVLRTADSLRSLGEAITRVAPDAWVLNLANPLGISTALLKIAGVERVVGICELPAATAMEAATVLGCDVTSFSWEYAGLNHRGFLVNATVQREDAIPLLLDRLVDGTLGGMRAITIAALHAIPTRNFQLMLQASLPTTQSRARYLQDLRRQIMIELRTEPDLRPPSLSFRRTNWYDLSVVPLLRALRDPVGAELIVDVMGSGGIVEEGLAHVSRRGISPLQPPQGMTAAVKCWLDAFRTHEHALLAMALQTDARRIKAAVETDPSIPDHLRPCVTDCLLRRAITLQQQ